MAGKDLTDEEAFNYASSIMAEGTAHRAQMQPDPPLHIVTEGSELWCTGGPAHKGENTPRRRYCRRCLTLARDMYDDLKDDESDDDEGHEHVYGRWATRPGIAGGLLRERRYCECGAFEDRVVPEERGL